MALRRAFSALLLGTLVGCGGATFGGLGGDDIDSGATQDSSGGDDALFPTDDGASPETGDDGATLDSFVDDSGNDTLADTEDATIVDSDVDATDSTVIDTGVDSAPIDTGVDTGSPDTGSPDTGPADTGVADTGPADTGPADTGPADTGVADTGTPDTGPADTGVADTGSDAGLLSTNPNQVYCGDTAGQLCAAGDVCCGAWSGSWSYACSSSSCGLGQNSFTCNEKADCSGGNVCCATYAPLSSNLNGSSCRSSCRSWQVQLCMTDAECGSGTCSFGSVQGASNQTIGVCK